jgi:mannonate dehydratase
MKRRTLLKLLGVGGVGVATGAAFWPDEGIFNPCYTEATPAHLLNHELVSAAWRGVQPAQMWDCHCHLIGNGDSDSGIWLHESMQDMLSPLQSIRYQFYLNASCAKHQDSVDRGYIQTMLRLLGDFPVGVKCMLLAFDFHHDEQGRRDLLHSPFSVPDNYAARIAKQYPDRFEWIASIHPYREDCVEALQWAVAHGARAIKWLPPVMGMDPASPLCDRFYAALLKYNIPILTHAGDEHAVHGVDTQAMGNPLLLRRPLEQGVRVIVAHCASQGFNIDIDQGPRAEKVSNFHLFTRLMNEPRYAKNLFGDISAMTQLNRIGEPIEQALLRSDWQPRLLNGSDYPLPGVMPLFSSKELFRRDYITRAEAVVLAELRRHNPLLYDFVAKRTMRIQGKTLSATVFETRRVFDPQAASTTLTTTGERNS